MSEGGNVIPSDSEAIFYGILDILAKPVFGALLLWGHRNIDLSRLGLHIHDPTEGRTAATSEKHVTDGHHNNGITSNNSTGVHTTTNTTTEGPTQNTIPASTV